MRTILPARALRATASVAVMLLSAGVVDLAGLTAVRAAETAGVQTNARPPGSEADLRAWLENMVWGHQYTLGEVVEATGLPIRDAVAALNRFDIRFDNRPERTQATLEVLPYPGGRHPRIGFLDGAVDPQRETKVSVFAPWPGRGYVVVDVPEAIWHQDGLLYLAHTHVPTVWTRQGVTLPRLEWNLRADGSLDVERNLPNRVSFGAKVVPRRDHVEFELWIRNRSERTLSDLRIQNCVMLKGLPGFTEQTNANKVLRNPYAVARNAAGDRWVITAWEGSHRVWANPPVPCIHADPKFEDCAPGQMRRLRGWLSFYAGQDFEAELERIDRLRARLATR